MLILSGRAHVCTPLSLQPLVGADRPPQPIGAGGYGLLYYSGAAPCANDNLSVRALAHFVGAMRSHGRSLARVTTAFTEE